MKKKILANSVTYAWHESIYNINQDDWNRIYGKNIIKSYEFYKSQYDAHISNATFLFLTVSVDNIVVAIAPCFKYKLDIAIIAPKWIQSACHSLRKWKRDFLVINIFGVGSLASTCENHVEIIDNLEEITHRNVCNIISEQIKTKSKQLKIKLVLIKEVPRHDLPKMKEILQKDFYFYHSLPTSIIPLFDGIPTYPDGLRRKERYRYHKLKQIFDQKYYWEKIVDFKSITKLFTEYYLSTLTNSPVKFEILNENFFHNINKNLSEKSFLLLAKDYNGTIHSIGLVLNDTHSLMPLYIGLNYNNSANELKIIHINSIFHVIEEAVNDNKQLVYLGQNSYYSKVLSGAYIEHIFLGFYSYSKILQLCIRNIFGKLFAPTTVLPNASKSDISEHISRIFHEFNINTMN